MIFRTGLLLLLLVTLVPGAALNLAGEWKLHLDSKDEWLAEDAANWKFKDRITLPGTTDLAKKGTHVTAARPSACHLTREWEFTGAAYYERRISIPEDWKDKEVELFLERVMWRSRVWLDGKEVSSPRDSLSTPHHHQLGKLEPGEHTLVVCVDNRMIHPIGDKSHGYGDQTQSKWNGIIGRMELRLLEEQRIERVRVFPALDGPLSVEVNGSFDPASTLSVICRDPDPRAAEPVTPVAGGKAESNRVILSGAVNFQHKKPWDEFSPKLYEAIVQLKDAQGRLLDEKITRFGFREVTRDGTQLLINGRAAFMRGNLECAVFPKTGHPPVTVEAWKKIWKTYQAHGLNHARFHSWCPPEAAFIAADEMGIYLQIETPIWIDQWMTQPNARPGMDTEGYPQGLGLNDRGIDEFTLAELRRIQDAYGNHPSFVFFCFGNELGTSDFAALGSWVDQARQYDPRHLYAASTARKITPHCDFNATHHIPDVGACRQHFEFGTAWDYESIYQRSPVPIMAHEIGQWPVFIDWQNELKKFTGPLKPYRLRDMAEASKKTGVYPLAKRLQAASGATHRLLYRYEIESFLRTPSCRGFQLLGMRDFPGQGEALIGWLDAFDAPKGTTQAEDFRSYCAPMVPLLKLPAFVFKAGDQPEVEALLHHYGPADLKQVAATCTVRMGSTKQVHKLPRLDVARGGVVSLGKFTPDFSMVKTATAVTLTIDVKGVGANRYDVWVYPDEIDVYPAGDVVLTADWTEARAALEQGRTVVLMANQLGDDACRKRASWMPLYWSSVFLPGQDVETLGLWVDGKHPALAKFPTPGYADWNWFRLCRGARGFDLTDVTPHDFKAIAMPVPDFHASRRLASIFEARVGKGKLLVCGYDIAEASARKFPEVAQLRRSLLDYAGGKRLAPAQSMTLENLERVFAIPAVPADAATESP